MRIATIIGVLYFACEWQKKKVLDARKIDTRDNLADLFTKPFGRERFEALSEIILGNAPPSSLRKD